ncbi:MAG: hypothetical protein VYC39_04070 [Myxococcota bacterium]|nr:hypothetical protein [Myxococcota bacterium]
MHLRSLLFSASLLSVASLAGAYPNAHWEDGKAELSGYTLTQPRYGQLRTGTAVHIFVKEDFSEKAKVKADYVRSAKDQVPIIKLNFIKKFPTGIYDYNLMTSVFAPFGSRQGLRAGMPIKVSYAQQEWCGSLYDELKTESSGIQLDRHTYFDRDELKMKSLPHQKNGIMVDELPFLVRQFPVPYLQPGESKDVRFLPSYERARLLHTPHTWMNGSFSRSKTASTLKVPAGQFQVETWTAKLGGNEIYRYFVEQAFPHRIIAWDGPQGERAELKGNTRLPYWQLNNNGGEKYLRELGFTP